MQLENVPAIVTGGASGLGQAVAEALARGGARVAVLDRNLPAAQEVVQRIGGFAALCDVTDPASAEAALAAARAAHGSARILVHCAGIGTAARIVGRDGPMPLDDFSRVIQVNLIGTFNMLRLASAAMSVLDPVPGEAGRTDGERGVIINTASVAAYEGQVGQAAYAASKGGIVALTLPAARELARFGIRVVTIAPGLFLTPLMDQLPVEAQASLGAAIPYPPRLGRASEFAALACHIIGNVFLNGETIRLDGALRMAPR